MEIKEIEKASGWVASNGILYDTKIDANQAQLEINLMELVRNVGMCAGGEWTQAMIVKELSTHIGTLDAISTHYWDIQNSVESD